MDFRGAFASWKPAPPFSSEYPGPMSKISISYCFSVVLILLGLSNHFLLFPLLVNLFIGWFWWRGPSTRKVTFEIILRPFKIYLNSDIFFGSKNHAGFTALDVTNIVKKIYLYFTYISRTTCPNNFQNFNPSWKRFNVWHSKSQVSSVAFRQHFGKMNLFTYNQLQ